MSLTEESEALYKSIMNAAYGRMVIVRDDARRRHKEEEKRIRAQFDEEIAKVPKDEFHLKERLSVRETHDQRRNKAFQTYSQTERQAGWSADNYVRRAETLVKNMKSLEASVVRLEKDKKYKNYSEKYFQESAGRIKQNLEASMERLRLLKMEVTGS
jgi:hypothetical protein